MKVLSRQHGVAAVIEELGVVLVLAADGEVAGVVNVVVLEVALGIRRGSGNGQSPVKRTRRNTHFSLRAWCQVFMGNACTAESVARAATKVAAYMAQMSKAGSRSSESEGGRDYRRVEVCRI